MSAAPRSHVRWIVLASTAGLALAADPVAAQAPADDAWRYDRGELAVDVAIASGAPSALPTGLARGLAGGAQWGRCWAVGARIAWLASNESTAIWQVNHDELRLRVFGAAQREVGRATLALRFGAGGTLIAESRLRQQGMRAGLTGDELETSKLALVPTASFDGVVGLHVRGPWVLQLSGGPGVLVLDGAPRPIWSAEIGVAWHR